MLSPAFVVPLVLGVAALAVGRHASAWVFAVVLTVVTGIRLASGFRFDHALGRAAERTGTVIGAVAAGLVFAALVLPLWLIRRVFGERALEAGSDGGWHRVGRPGAYRRWYGTAPPRPRRRRLVWQASGLVFVVAVANYTVGAAWDSASPESPRTAPGGARGGIVGGSSQAPLFGPLRTESDVGDDLADLWDVYSRHSAAHRALRWLEDRLSSDESAARVAPAVSRILGPCCASSTSAD